MAELAAGLERVASGDLTTRLEQPFAAGYEALRSDFNRALGEARAVTTILRLFNPN